MGIKVNKYFTYISLVLGLDTLLHDNRMKKFKWISLYKFKFLYALPLHKNLFYSFWISLLFTQNFLKVWFEHNIWNFVWGSVWEDTKNIQQIYAMLNSWWCITSSKTSRLLNCNAPLPDSIRNYTAFITLKWTAVKVAGATRMLQLT